MYKGKLNVLGITEGGTLPFQTVFKVSHVPFHFWNCNFLNIYNVCPVSLLVFYSNLEKEHHSSVLRILRMDTLQNLTWLCFLLFSFWKAKCFCLVAQPLSFGCKTLFQVWEQPHWSKRKGKHCQNIFFFWDGLFLWICSLNVILYGLELKCMVIINVAHQGKERVLFIVAC